MPTQRKKKSSTKKPVLRPQKPASVRKSPKRIQKKRSVATPPKKQAATPQKHTVAPPPVTNRRRSLLQSLGFQVIIAGGAVAVLLILAMVERGTFATHESQAAEPVSVSIGVEHPSPLPLSILIARKEAAGYISLTNGSAETIRLTLPAAWSRQEVTGAPLSDVTAEELDGNAIRWTIPGYTTIRLTTPQIPDVLVFSSPSPSTAAVTIKSVSLTSDSADKRVILMKGGATITLWGEE